MTWLDFKIGARLVGEWFDKSFIEIAIGWTFIGSIVYNINDASIQASMYAVTSILLLALYDVRRGILKHLDSPDIEGS